MYKKIGVIKLTTHFLQTLQIPQLDKAVGAQITQYLDTLTKPKGSLGRLEEFVIALGEMTGEAFPQVHKPGVIVFAADHGITAEGVSPYPQEVTVQMTENFLQGGATMAILSRLIEAEFAIVDVGIASDMTGQGLIVHKVNKGTKNFLVEDAMTRDEALIALQIGYDEGIAMLEKGVKSLILGELGIGNTSPSSAIIAVLTGKPVAQVVGAGSGLVNEQVVHKQKVIAEAIAARQPNKEDAIDLLSKLGGFEIAAMTGAMLAAASMRKAVIVDGFISTVSAILAEMLAPGAKNYMFVGHHSAEPGHEAALQMLAKEPIVALQMRLGEGTGAAVAYPILRAATQVLKELPTLDAAGVSNIKD